jgi:hypothetical protein
MMVGARGHVTREDLIARRMILFWDQSWTKNLAAAFLSFLWLGVAGQAVVPLGLMLALQLMAPEVPGWSLWRRLTFAGRRTVTLVALALAGFLFAHAQIGIFHPDGSSFYVRPRFLVPTALGWIDLAEKHPVVAHLEACNNGVAESCALLGRAHLEGDGVDPDPRAAVGYFETACDAGHWIACVSLGKMYSRGIGVAADRTAAKQLYVEACQQGELVGCHNQGALQLAEGHYESGMDALMRACSSDFGRSCFLVGEQYRLGTGRQPKNHRRAKMWLAKACRLDVEEACELVERLNPRGRSRRAGR